MNLREYLFIKKMTTIEFGKRCDLHSSHIRAIIKGRFFPGRKSRKIIYDVSSGMVNIFEKTVDGKTEVIIYEPPKVQCSREEKVEAKSGTD